MLEIKNLTKKYNNGFLLHDISFRLEPGDFTVLFGEDDSGKTMCIYNIIYLHHFYKGEILFQGRPLQRLSEKERREMIFVPDSVCMENMILEAYLKVCLKRDKQYKWEDIIRMCEYFGVALNVSLTDMTYNENKLATIIGAVAAQPKLLILDEPANMLTQESNTKLVKFLQYLSNMGMTILITTSDSREVKDYCNKYIYMKNGAIAHSGDMKELYGSQKAVTVTGGDRTVCRELLGTPITRGDNRETYLFKKLESSKALSEILAVIGDWEIEIENLTLEEILDKNYTRWM